MYSVIDTCGVLLAVLAYLPLFVLPGYAIAAALRALDWDIAPPRDRASIALAVSFATLPVIDSLMVQFLGPSVAVCMNLSLGVLGLVVVWRQAAWPLVNWRWTCAGLIWLCLVIFELIDFDVQGGLRQSLIEIDLVKHAATINAIEWSGAPPVDPFFARDGRSGYYYFFYTNPALVTHLLGRVLDARAAFAGLVFWEGIGFLALVNLVIARCGFTSPHSARRMGWVVLALLACTGLDLVGILIWGYVPHRWFPQLDWWNEEVTTWLCSILWVPHHLNALIASWVALVALAREVSRPTLAPTALLRCVVLAGLGFATSFGASVWLTMATCATMSVWLGTLAFRGMWRGVATACAAGAVALATDLGTILDLLANRTDSRPPIGLWIRAFKIWDVLVAAEPARSIGRLLLLPLNYGLEFGVFALGTWLFWHRRRTFNPHKEELGRLLSIGAISGLVLATFVRSTVISNDLGWRAMLFPQLAALVWGAVVLDDMAQRGAASPAGPMSWFGRQPRAVGVALIVGYLGVAYGVICARLPSSDFEPSGRYINSRPDVDRDLRFTYEWASDHLLPNEVLQHNPTQPRAFDFGLYGRNRVAVADWQGNLFGASPAQVRARVSSLGLIYSQSLPAAEVQRIAAANGVSYLLVTSADPVWYRATSWVWTSPYLVSRPNVRMIAVATIRQGAPDEKKLGQ